MKKLVKANLVGPLSVLISTVML